MAATIAVAAAGATIAGRVVTGAVTRGHRTVVLQEMPRRPPLPEAAVRDSDIAFYERRIARDPTGAMDLARLARLHLRRARETGDYADVQRADSLARRSLGNRTAHNAAALQVLGASLLTEHRFADALAVERALAVSDPGRIAYRAAYGEVAFELGAYDLARATFDSLRAVSHDLAVAPRLARWEEIEGRTAAARHLLHVALDQAARRPDLPREQIAWLWLRLGDLELRGGRPDVAAYAYRQGMEHHPGDYRILAAMAHLAAVRHDWRSAIRAGEQAIVSNLDPATLGTLSDASAALGDSARATEYARVMEVAVTHQPGSYHRAWSLFLLDHDRRSADVLARAREELRTRRDIYGWDVLAWALYRTGRIGEAQQAVAQALGQGTQDGLLFYHAGAIASAAGDTSGARAYLTRALRLNPYFDALHADSARRALARLAQGTRDMRPPSNPHWDAPRS